jgi:DNA-binding transcriptional LysR family regulator
MDRLTAMEAFVAVAEEGSFTKAAARMRLSTAMMTLHINRLEQHLGTRLFNRTTRRVDLTEDGRQLLEHARAALDAYMAAEGALRPGSGPRGRVRVDVPASLGHAFVVPALAEFRSLHPDIVLDLTLGDRGTFFRLDGFDIVIRAGEIPVSDWQTVPLGQTRLVCVASPSYLEQHGTPLVPDDLNHHRCILYASVEMPGGNPWTFLDGERKVRVRPPAAFSFNDGAAIMATARAGLGIAQNLEMLARRDLEAGTLVPVLPDIARSPLSVALMGSKERLAMAHVRAVLGFLTERIDWALDRA